MFSFFFTLPSGFITMACCILQPPCNSRDTTAREKSPRVSSGVETIGWRERCVQCKCTLITNPVHIRLLYWLFHVTVATRGSLSEIQLDPTVRTASQRIIYDFYFVYGKRSERRNLSIVSLAGTELKISKSEDLEGNCRGLPIPSKFPVDAVI